MPLLPTSRRGPNVDVGALLDATTSEYVASIIQGGALVSLFRTRDAGAFGCAVTLDGEQEKEYFRTPEEFHAWLRLIDEVVTAAPESPPKGKRPRTGS